MKIDIPYEGTIEFVYDGLIESVRHVDNFSKLEPQIKEQVVYKLRHKHTGLFFEPQQYHGNVSKNGKVYSNKKPPRQSFIKIPHGVEIENGFDITQLPKARHQDCYKTKLDDWEVISYTLTEIKE